MHLLRTVAIVQGAYFAVTGLWPLVHIRSFMAVTGPKTDLWLVRTVGLLVLCVGAVVALAGWRDWVTAEVALLAVSGAAALAAVDVVYVLRRVIARVYLLDAVAEGALVALWAVALPRG